MAKLERFGIPIGPDNTSSKYSKAGEPANPSQTNLLRVNARISGRCPQDCQHLNITEQPPV